jgi:methylase of polypeptide subunit release factors
MTITDINTILASLEEKKRENVFDFAAALLQWMKIEPNPGRPQLISPQTQKLKDFLFPAPQTVQPQLYRLSADNQNIRVRFAVLKKLKKEYISQLVDNDPGLTSFQASIKGIINIPGREPYIPSKPYFIHFVTTPDYDKLVLIFNQGEQKRIVSFRKRLTHTQYNKIMQAWQDIATKPKPEIADLVWKSLDIKEVNREFYKQIKERFDAVVGIAKVQQPNAADADVKQFAVRLIGRYIFCWFLKEKGVIPEQLLASKTIEDNINDFFQKYLYQLYFNTLNEEVQSRTAFKSGTDLDALYHNIPYLNGGLFDKHPEDVLFEKLNLNHWLIDFVKVLENFDFTVDESSSQYQHVAIDPEMLGRIFENLLASQNEETSSLANQRKAFGAFYTPREIVDYMVNESLKAHLETCLLPAETTADNVVNDPLVAYKGSLFAGLEPQQTQMNFQPPNPDKEKKRQRTKEKIEKLFAHDCNENPFDKTETQQVRHALSDVKILDPACGSGAFPMGILLRLMELRQIVGHEHRGNYELKNEILRRNIFGVDIMPMAVEIARLRAWLSLVLDAEYKPTDRKNNFGISALPNLDFKFVCANSLVDIPENKYVEKMAYNELADFERLTEKYFNASLGDKIEIKTAIENCINSITEFHDIAIKRLQEQIKSEGKSSKEGKLNSMKTLQEDYEKQHRQWHSYKNLFTNKTVEFFNTKYFFPSVKDGFDVVIGNPPYVQMQKNNGKLAVQLKEEGYATFERTGDVYAIFYELGFKVLKQKGVHVFITSSQWMKANYGKSLRRLFLSKNPIKLIALGPGMFETAVVDTNILIAKNETNKKQLQGSVVVKPEQINNLNALTFQPMSYVTVDNWAILNEGNQSINEKINAKGKPLSEWKIQINFGIKTGYNEAFIIDETQRKELVKSDAKTAEIIKPVLRGREIEKYYTEWDGGYLISTFPSLHVNILKYKAVKKYLEGFLPKINQTGEIFINEEGKEENTRKKTTHKWYETQDPIGYYKELSKEKVIWKRIGSQLRFSYSDSEIYCLDSTCIATGEKIKYLTALLNSKLCNYQLFESAPKTGMGDLIISVQALEPLLIYYPTDKEQKQIENLVDEILKKKKAKHDTNSLEKEIDVLVYKLYELTYDEVKIIDKDFWLSEEEYEKVKIV